MFDKTAAKWVRKVVEAYRQAKKRVPDLVYHVRGDTKPEWETAGWNKSRQRGAAAISWPDDPVVPLSEQIGDRQAQREHARAMRMNPNILRQHIEYYRRALRPVGPREAFQSASHSYRTASQSYLIDKMRRIYETKRIRMPEPMLAPIGKPLTAAMLAARYGGSPEYLYKGATKGGPAAVDPRKWTAGNYARGIWFTNHPQIAAGYTLNRALHPEDMIMAVMQIPKKYRRLTGIMTSRHVATPTTVSARRAARMPGEYLSKPVEPVYKDDTWSLDPYYETQLRPEWMRRYIEASPLIEHFMVTKPRQGWRMSDTDMQFSGRGFQDVHGMDGLLFTPVRYVNDLWYTGKRNRVPMNYRYYI